MEARGLETWVLSQLRGVGVGSQDSWVFFLTVVGEPAHLGSLFSSRIKPGSWRTGLLGSPSQLPHSSWKHRLVSLLRR